jgi:L-ribulose-5-phosphate 3-epimerase
MKTAFLIFATLLCNFSSFGQSGDGRKKGTVDPKRDWKLGVAMYTFHTVSFPAALDRVDSAGVRYIEGMTFHKSGHELKDTLISKLSPSGLARLRKLVNDKGIKMESIYIGGGKTVESWKKEFEIAKTLGVKFVTAEPPVPMWDSIDSLAGVYKMKVAIHEHWKGVSAYWHPDSVLAAIKDHPNFGACADLGHWPKSGIDPVEGVKKLNGHIIAIHLKDIAAFDDPKLKDVTVGTGVVNFPGVFAELKRQNFKGHIYIEKDVQNKPDNLPSVRESIQYYHKQIDKLK